MVVAQERVHEAEKSMARCRIDELVDPREGVAVLWANLVQVGVVDIDAPLPTGLLDHDDVG